jgi:hypothetical protein
VQVAHAPGEPVYQPNPGFRRELYNRFGVFADQLFGVVYHGHEELRVLRQSLPTNGAESIAAAPVVVALEDDYSTRSVSPSKNCVVLHLTQFRKYLSVYYIIITNFIVSVAIIVLCQ